MKEYSANSARKRLEYVRAFVRFCHQSGWVTPVRDVIAWGSQHSSLGYVSEQVANSVGLTVGPDPFPDEGLFVRSDQFSFVKRGIPSVFLDTGMTSSTPNVDALAIRKKWLVTAYHSPKDDASQAFDFGTSTKFAHFVFLLGHAIATDPMRPSWHPNDFFGKAFSVRHP